MCRCSSKNGACLITCGLCPCLLLAAFVTVCCNFANYLLHCLFSCINHCCSCHCLLQFCKLPLALIALVTVCCNFANYLLQALATLQSCGLPQEAASANSQQPSRTERHHPKENQSTPMTNSRINSATPPYTTIDHTNDQSLRCRR